MGRGKFGFNSGVLRVAPAVFAIVQLLRFAQNVYCQPSSEYLFCDKFVSPFGFRCRRYTTLTTDGYLLVAHRINNEPTVDRPLETIHDYVWDPDVSQPPKTSGFKGYPSLIHSSMHQRRQNSMGSSLQEPFVESKTMPEITGRILSSSSSSRKRLHGNRRRGNVIKGSTSNPMTTLEASPFGVTREQTVDSDSIVDAESSPPPPSTYEGESPAEGAEPTPPPQSTYEGVSPAEGAESTPPPPSTYEGMSPAEAAEPVLLMHQEFQNGNSWFLSTDTGSDQRLPFMLLKSNFDVWIGHHRATYYGHDHATLKHDDEDYWNWSWDEQAKYDIPALLELVHQESGSTVHLVGISQSATGGAAAATMPSVSPLLSSLTLIGPTIFRGNTTSHMLAAWASLLGSNVDTSLFDTTCRNGVFNLTSDLVTRSIASLGPVASIMTDISGPNCCLGVTKVKFDNGWDGTTSCKNMLHYQQDIRTNKWSHFDYGSVPDNSMAYDGRPLPPTYNPEDIPASLPVLVIYGGKDSTAPPSGSREFISALTNPSSINSSVFLPTYAHLDLSYSVNRTQAVFLPILRFLEKQRRQL